jgi:UDP-glucose 4-epimerase
MEQSRKILVTGGLGLIGHNVVNRLQALGHWTTVMDNKTNYGIIPEDEMQYLFQEREKRIAPDTPLYVGDISVSHNVDYVFRQEQPDTVIHMASFPRQKVVNAAPALGSRTMMEGLLNLLEAARLSGVKKFVYISSSMVYGDFRDAVTEDAECRPQGQYGIMKLAGEWLVRDYTRKYGMAHVVIRPSAVYGPLDVEDRVISRFLITAMRGETIRVNGANERLDFTYVDDAADGIVAACLRDQANNHTFNITKSHAWTLLEAAQLAQKLVGRGDIEVRDRDQDFPSRGRLDITLAQQLLDFNPKVDIDQGFQIYHNWIINSDYWRQRLAL